MARAVTFSPTESPSFFTPRFVQGCVQTKKFAQKAQETINNGGVCISLAPAPNKQAVKQAIRHLINLL